MAVKKMVIRVFLEGKNDLKFTTRESRAVLATLSEMFGEAHVIVPRNPHGRKGSPETQAKRAKVAAAAQRAARKSAKVAATA